MNRGTRHWRSRRNRAPFVDLDANCIDLTSADEEFVDLTSSQSENGANDSSVVIIGSTSDSPPASRRRRRIPPPETFDDDSLIELPPAPIELPTPVRRRRLPLPDTSDDDSLELPPAPIELPTPVRSTRRSIPTVEQSPEPMKITCPICLDDDKTIRKEKKQFASTICGHVFCRDCLTSCVTSQKCCPVCRKRLYLKDIHTLHF